MGFGVGLPFVDVCGDVVVWVVVIFVVGGGISEIGESGGSLLLNFGILLCRGNRAGFTGGREGAEVEGR